MVFPQLGYCCGQPARNADFRQHRPTRSFPGGVDAPMVHNRPGNGAAPRRAGGCET